MPVSFPKSVFPTRSLLFLRKIARGTGLPSSFLAHRWLFIIVSSHARRGKVSFQGFFYKGINPIHESSTLMTQSYLTGSHLQMLGVGFQHVNSMGVRNTKGLKGQIDFCLAYSFKIHSLEIFPWNCPKRSFSDYSYVIQIYWPRN